MVVATGCPLEFLVRAVLANGRFTAQVFQLMHDRVHSNLC